MRGPEPITPNFRDAPWFDMYIMKYKVPGNARHGCMIPLAQKQYDAILAAYGSDV